MSFVRFASARPPVFFAGDVVRAVFGRFVRDRLGDRRFWLNFKSCGVGTTNAGASRRNKGKRLNSSHRSNDVAKTRLNLIALFVVVFVDGNATLFTLAGRGCGLFVVVFVIVVIGDTLLALDRLIRTFVFVFRYCIVVFFVAVR